MIYLLGGPPRVGKTIVAKNFLKKYGVSFVSTDALRKVQKNVVASKDNPDLFVLNQRDTMSETEKIRDYLNEPQKVVRLQNTESVAAWNGTTGFITEAYEDNYDYLIEGVGILPELVSKLQIPVNVLFVGNTSEQHGESIFQTAKRNPHDWLHGNTEDFVRAFGNFVRVMSEYFRSESEKYGYRYLDLAKGDFNEKVSEICEQLFHNR